MSGSAALSRFLDQVRQRGFEVSPGPTDGVYLIRGATAPERRGLILDEILFDEYVETAVDGWELPPGSSDRAEEVLSLMVVNLEAALAGVDVEGRNYVTELGIRRGGTGAVEWYQAEDGPADVRAPQREGDPELGWVGEPPS